MTQAPMPAPITRADLMSWGKVAAIVGPLLFAIIGASVKLSSDAQAVRTDVDALKVTVAEHSRIIDGLREVGPTLGRISSQLTTVAAMGDTLRMQSMTLEERLKAQDSRVQLFWSQTWPTMEDRLKRIENKLDRSNR